MSPSAMRAVDTNVVVRLLARDDAQQVAAAEAFVKDGAWVSHVVLAEAIWVLDSVYELTHQQIVTALDMLLDHDTLSLQDSDIVSAALDRFRGRSAPGFSDCLVLEIARKAGHLPLGTFDRDLAKLPDAQRLTASKS
jgi:predicted nucleic-acid-binding protein